MYGSSQIVVHFRKEPVKKKQGVQRGKRISERLYSTHTYYSGSKSFAWATQGFCSQTSIFNVNYIRLPAAVSACSDADHMGPRLQALFAACAPLHHSTTRPGYLCRRVTWSGAPTKHTFVTQTQLCYVCLNVIIFVRVCFVNHQREKFLFHGF